MLLGSALAVTSPLGLLPRDYLGLKQSERNVCQPDLEAAERAAQVAASSLEAILQNVACRVEDMFGIHVAV